MNKNTTISRKSAKVPAADLSTVDGVLAAMQAKSVDLKEGKRLLGKLVKEEEAKQVSFEAVHDAKYPHPAIRAKVGAKQLFAPLPVWQGIADNLAALQAAIADAIALKSGK